MICDTCTGIGGITDPFTLSRSICPSCLGEPHAIEWEVVEEIRDEDDSWIIHQARMAMVDPVAAVNAVKSLRMVGLTMVQAWDSIIQSFPTWLHVSSHDPDPYARSKRLSYRKKKSQAKNWKRWRP